MEKTRKDLYNISMALVLVVLHLCARIGRYIYKLFNISLETLAPTEVQLAQTMYVTVAIINVLILALMVLLVFRGVSESRKPTAAKAHILIARVLGFIYAISVIGSVTSLFDGTDIALNAVEALFAALYVFLMMCYAQKAHLVRAD